MASTCEPVQATENLIADKEAPSAIVPSIVHKEDGGVKESEPSASHVIVQGSEQAVPSTIGTKATETVTHEPTTTAVDAASPSASGDVKKVETKETITSGPDAPITAATPKAPGAKTEEVKISVTKVVAGVAEDINNVEVGLAKEAPPTSGENVSKPSLVATVEGGLKIVEKEAAKGAVETVGAVEQHPELIAEGALAAVVGAASMLQPELLPGAVALVGKMASDSVKKTVVGIATTEGKKVGAAIGKDISNDAAQAKAAKNGEGNLAATITPSETPKDVPKTVQLPNELAHGHDKADQSPAEKLAKPETSAAPAQGDPLKSKQEETPTESTASAPQNVEEAAKPIPSPEKTEPALEAASEPAVVVATAASFTTTTTTKTTNGKPAAPLDKAMVTISQESLDLLHRKIDAMHDAIKQITETLALRLPPPTPAITSSQPTTTEVITSEAGPVMEHEPEASNAVTTETLVEPVTQESEQASPKRPKLEKRASVLGSIGKILWPFGSASPMKGVFDSNEVTTEDSSAPKVATVTVTEVRVTPEIEV